MVILMIMITKDMQILLILCKILLFLGLTLGQKNDQKIRATFGQCPKGNVFCRDVFPYTKEGLWKDLWCENVIGRRSQWIALKVDEKKILFKKEPIVLKMVKWQKNMNIVIGLDYGLCKPGWSRSSCSHLQKDLINVSEIWVWVDVGIQCWSRCRIRRWILRRI